MRCGTRRTTGPPCPIRLDREGCRDAPTEVSSRFRFASIRPGAFPCLRQPGPGSLTGESRPTKNPHTRTPARWGPVALCRGLPHAGAPAGPIPVRSSGVPALRRSHPPLCVAYGRPQSGGGDPGGLASGLILGRSQTDGGRLRADRGRACLVFVKPPKPCRGGVGGCPAEGPSPDHVMSDARPVFGYGEDFLVMPRARSVVSAALPSALRCGFRAEVHCWCFRCVPSCGISVRSPHLSTHPVSLRRGERDESGGDAQDAGSPLWLLRLCPAGTIPFGVCADPS